MLIRTRVANVVGPILDFLLLVVLVPSALVLKFVRRIGVQRLPACRTVLAGIGVLPIRNHYYEPFVTSSNLKHSLSEPRGLPGIDWDVSAQLEFLSSLTYEHEFVEMVEAATGAGSGASGNFRFDNGSFGPGDAEYLYQVVRRLRPKHVIEIGSGHSTLIVRSAIAKNRLESSGYQCEHVCIEPYEARWLEGHGIRVIRQRLEDVDVKIFGLLGDGDLLFIDSSHVIRPQGDVVTECLQILPALNQGVVVHVHDIFSPRDYPAEWVFGKRLLWNEQYLLEAFLSNNCEWSVLGALNLLKHSHLSALRRACPYLDESCEPASVWLIKKKASVSPSQNRIQ